MTYKPLEYFVGRKVEIDKFNELLNSDTDPWVMLVDGLSGTGKSLLVDWLRKYSCQEIYHARLTLALSANTYDLMSSIAEQLHPKVADQYERGLESRRVAEERQTLINFSPTQGMNANTSGLIENPTQTISMDVGNLAKTLKDDRETRRLDLLVDSIAQHLRGKTWVLFIDEAGYLDNPELAGFFLKKLFPRLHSRFSHFRLYLTGQNVPTASFSKHERLEATLEVFQESDTNSLLQKARISDIKFQKSIFSITLGHPLLIGMLVEHILENGIQTLKADAKILERTLDEGERTEWIYDRIIDNISDPQLREIAANLSLFEWFDLSLLREVFNQQISEESFTGLVRRSFIKTLDQGKWRCHDIIIKYLRPHRRLLLQDESGEIHAKIVDALDGRIAAQQEKEGTWSFRDRINLTSAVLSSLLEISSAKAHDFLLTEIAMGLFIDVHYLYPLARFAESQPISETMRQELMQAKDSIEAINLEQTPLEAIAFLDQLGQHLYGKGNTKIAAYYLKAAANMFMTAGEHDRALTSAKQACQYEDSLESQTVLVRALTFAEKDDAAAELISNLSQKYGDQTILQVERARLAYRQDQREVALKILYNAIALQPDQIDARRFLMERLLEEAQYEAALNQAEIILKIDPGEKRALIVCFDVLIRLGRYDEVIPKLQKSELPLASGIDELAPAFGILNDPLARGRLLAEMELKPESFPANLMIIMICYFSIAGNVQIVEKMVTSAENRWPEFSPLCQMYRAFARLNSGMTNEAQTLAEDLIKRGNSVPDTYFILATCYSKQGKFDEGIRILDDLADRFPYSRDLVEYNTANIYGSAKQYEPGLAYLEQKAQGHPLNPFSLMAKADLYIGLDKPEEAIQILEELIYTTGRSDLPIQVQLNVRAKYAGLLAQKGEREKAADIAYSILRLSVDPSLKAMQAAGIFLALQDYEGLREAYRSNNNWDINSRTSFLSWMTAILLQRNPGIDGLLAEFKAHPDRLEFVIALDQIITQTNQIDLGPDIFQKIEQIAPGTTATYIKFQSDLLSQASPMQIQQLETAIKVHPENITLYFALGRVRLAMGQFAIAKKVFDEAVRLNPEFEGVVVQLQATALLDAGELELAKALLEPYLAIQSPPWIVVEALRRYLAAIGDWAAEINLLENAARVYPYMRQHVTGIIVDHEIQDEHYEHALEILDRLSLDEELHHDLVASRIKALTRLERYPEALAAADEMLAKPDLAPLLRGVFWAMRAKCCLAVDNWKEAEDALLKAVKLDKNNASLHFTLADIYLSKEQWEMAYEAIMNGLALDPVKLPEYQEKLHDLIKKNRAPEEPIKP
jgi:tetratricopeptide (TPR) repeat protein